MAVYKDNILINSSESLGQFSKKKPIRPTLAIFYMFNQTGVYTLTSHFTHNNLTIVSDFAVKVKTGSQYQEEKLKGALITVFSFLLVAVFGIYLYEKLEKPRKNKKVARFK